MRTSEEDPDFAGWATTPAGEGYDASLAPLYWRTSESGEVRIAMRVAERHLNTQRSVHGGCLMTLADCALFALARRHLDPAGVTVSLAGDFLGAAGLGDILEATGDVLRAGGSLVFIRGVVATGERPVLRFSGVIKRLRRAPLSPPTR